MALAAIPVSIAAVNNVHPICLLNIFGLLSSVGVRRTTNAGLLLCRAALFFWRR